MKGETGGCVPDAVIIGSDGGSITRRDWRKQCKECTIEVKIIQRLTLWGPMDYIVHEILHSRILEWIAFPFSRDHPNPGDQTQVSHIAGGFFTRWATREALQCTKHRLSFLARHGGGCRHQLDSAPPLGSFLGSWGGVLQDKQAAWFENMCVFTSPAVGQIDIICFLIWCSEKDTSSLLWCAGQHCVTWV